MTPFRLAVLKIVSDQDGKCSWYQIERTLGRRGVIPDENVMTVLREFTAAGLIAEVPQPANPAQPLYKLLDKGKEALLQQA